MKIEKSENYCSEIQLSIRKSSTIRLLREIVRWSKSCHKSELDLIAVEIRRRTHLLKIAALLFFISITLSNVGKGFDEQYYLFDEDEREAHRQIRIGVLTHIISIVILASIIFLNVKVGCGMLLLYVFWSLMQTLKLFRPNFKIIKETAPNNV